MISVTYSSNTGNTKKLADKLNEVLKPQYFGIHSEFSKQADTIYVGFYTNNGIADNSALDFLKGLHNKNIFLFGTAGFGMDKQYFKDILTKTKQTIPKDNKIIGEFMCQGKMPRSVRTRYESIKMSNPDAPNIDLLLLNFDNALNHPNEQDLLDLVNALPINK